MLYHPRQKPRAKKTNAIAFTSANVVTKEITDKYLKAQSCLDLLHNKKMRTYTITSSRLNWLSLLSSISLNTFVVGAESPIFISSTSKTRVAPPGITLPAPRSPYPNSGGMVSFLFSPVVNEGITVHININIIQQTIRNSK